MNKNTNCAKILLTKQTYLTL